MLNVGSRGGETWGSYSGIFFENSEATANYSDEIGKKKETQQTVRRGGSCTKGGSSLAATPRGDFNE